MSHFVIVSTLEELGKKYDITYDISMSEDVDVNVTKYDIFFRHKAMRFKLVLYNETNITSSLTADFFCTDYEFKSLSECTLENLLNKTKSWSGITVPIALDTDIYLDYVSVIDDDGLKEIDLYFQKIQAFSDKFLTDYLRICIGRYNATQVEIKKFQIPIDEFKLLVYEEFIDVLPSMIKSVTLNTYDNGKGFRIQINLNSNNYDQITFDIILNVENEVYYQTYCTFMTTNRCVYSKDIKSLTKHLKCVKKELKKLVNNT